MKLTDPYVLKQLKIVRSTELEELIETYPEDQRNGRSDLEILWLEVDWLLYVYNNDNYGHNYDLWEARDILRRTQNGKILQVFDNYGNERKYYPHDIQTSKKLVNEYKRLNNLATRLAIKLNT